MNDDGLLGGAMAAAGSGVGLSATEGMVGPSMGYLESSGRMSEV